MPLNLAALKSGLLTACQSPGPTPQACAQMWADAVGAYFAAVTPPSSTVTSGKSVLAGALGSAFAAGQPAAVLSAMEAAFAAFAVTVGAGQAGWAPKPPAGSVGFSSLFAPPLPDSHAQAADRIATAIDAWARTGTSTMTAPPATTMPWT